MNVQMVKPIRDTFAVYETNGIKFRLEVHYWKVKVSDLSESIEAVVFKPGDGLVSAYVIEGYEYIEEVPEE